jgi:hypothetical protein
MDTLLTGIVILSTFDYCTDNSPLTYGEIVMGFEIKHTGTYVAHIKTKATKEYYTWRSMLNRCSREDYHQVYPTYIGCSVSENFKNFQYFAEWCNKQVGFGNKGWHLDKDILKIGNKVYSEDFCVFIPMEINSLRIGFVTNRGEYPMGVHFVPKLNKFKAGFCRNGVKEYLGIYETVEEAFAVYKQAREEYVKSKAIEYEGRVDNRVLEVMLNYKVPMWGNKV